MANPGLVTAEYQVGGGRADYALLSDDGNPKAFVEAKRLGEPLEAIKYQEQVFTYALIQQVRYAGLTDGNLWVLDNVAEFSGGERRKLEVSIALEPAFQCALKLLLLWRPNLASGRPVEANKPILSDGPSSELDNGGGATVCPPPPPPSGDWKPLGILQHVTGGPQPTAIRFSDGEERDTSYWWHILFYTAEWLVQNGKLTPQHCPVKLTNGQRYTVNHQAVHADDKPFTAPRPLSNGLFCESNFNAVNNLTHTKRLLEYFEEDLETILLRFS